MNKRITAFFSIGLAGFLLAGITWWKFETIALMAGRIKGRDNHLHGNATEKDAKHDHEHLHEHEKELDHGDERIVRIKAEEADQFGIEVEEVKPGRLETRLSLSGEVTVNADRMAHIVPRLSGVVRQVRKSVGDTVKQGEVMAVMESRELADAKAEYLAGLERLNLAQTIFSREEKLWQKNISAEQEYLDAKQALAEARIFLRSAEHKLHALGFSDQYLKELPKQHDESYTRYELIAPFDGTVIEKHITLGEALKEDADVFIVADLSAVWVNLSVYQKDLPLVQEGQKAVIAASHGIPDSEGTISYLSPIIREETRTALARIVLPNHQGHWRPGMFVTAEVGVNDFPVPMIVQKSALQTVDGKTVVFVQTKEGFVPKRVTVGRTSETGAEITSGLSLGERYAAKGALSLKADLDKDDFGHGHAH